MKKRYKFTTMLLVAALIVSIVGGSVAIGTGSVNDNPVMSEPGVLPFVEETVQLEIAMPQHTLVLNYDDNYMTNLCETETGLDLVFRLLPGAETGTAVDLMFASGDKLPEVFLYGFGNKTATYGAEGYFHVLNDYFDKENGLAYCFWNEATGMTDMDYTEYFARSTEADGNIYAFSFLTRALGDACRITPSINMEWLNALGLEKPTTKEELYDVLVAFRDGDPNGNGQKDEIPMIGGTWNGGDDEMIINMFTYWNPDYMLNVENDVVYAPFVTEEWQEAMKFMNKLVTEGLLSDLTFSITDDELVSLIQSFGPKDQIVGVLVGAFTTTIPDRTNESIMAYDWLAPMEGAYTPIRTANVTKYGYITEDCDKPELAFRFFDYWTNERRSVITRFGEPNVHWMWRADDPELYDSIFVGGDNQATRLMGWEARYEVLPGTVSPWTSENNVIWNTHTCCLLPAATYSAGSSSDSIVSNNWEESQSIGTLSVHRSYVNAKNNSLWGTNTPASMFTDPIYTLEETDMHNDTIQTVKSYVKECIAAFATGTLDPEADWDTYVANLYSAGLQDWVDLGQTYWTRSH